MSPDVNNRVDWFFQKIERREKARTSPIYLRDHARMMELVINRVEWTIGHGQRNAEYELTLARPHLDPKAGFSRRRVFSTHGLLSGVSLALFIDQCREIEQYPIRSALRCPYLSFGKAFMQVQEINEGNFLISLTYPRRFLWGMKSVLLSISIPNFLKFLEKVEEKIQNAR